MNENEFNVLTEDLYDSKVIEASAGTGKTFSIAVLVLRLILEREIPIEKILMVTFTKTAVAELESRIRKFIRQAYKYSLGKIVLPGDNKVRMAVDAAEKSIEEKKDLLRNALQGLDNLSVMTIHSFCQKTIDEFTFETGQAFNYEVVTDDSELLISASDKYLRETINAIEDLEKFRELEDDIKFENMHELLRKHLQGMTFIDSNTLIELNDIEENKRGKLEALKNRIAQELNRIQRVDISNRTELGRNRNSADAFLPVFIKHCCVQKNYDYIKLFDFIYYNHGKEYGEALELQNITYLDFFRKSEEFINRIKQGKGYIFYDDQIKTVFKALTNKSLVQKVASKYSAVFIDEFQDTDSYQYEIFRTVFTGNQDDPEDKPVVFYIGDPKQSIYGWRGADLDTYKKAKADLGDPRVRKMNTNYRSTKEMVDALNAFINPGGDFNLFMDDQIGYYNVDHGAAGLGTLSDNGTKPKPVTIWKFGVNDEKRNLKAVAREIFRLLDTDVKIKGLQEGHRKIRPGDIGVLVRDNREGDIVKRELAQYNIPAVKRDDKKVLDSDEAKLVSYLLKAVISPNQGDINRALLTKYTGFDFESVRNIDDEKHTDIFISLRKTLREEGIYNMISEFLTVYDVRSKCMSDVLGQRVLTNINQIAELLHKAEKQLKYTPDELLVWMKREPGEGSEEFEQRIESDDDAVQISTIHKAKGLEYNIVFAPCLCMLPKFKRMERNNVNDFKKESKYFFTFNLSALPPEDQAIFNTQKEQENRRLIYVALTRPVYKCYISYMPKTYKRVLVQSSMDDLFRKYNNSRPDLISIIDLSRERIGSPDRKYEVPETDKKVFFSKPTPKIEIKNTFGIHSYSGLSRAHHSAPFEKAELGKAEDYDQFIFQDLGRGANVGTALHSIFERLVFSKPETWIDTIREASKYYPNIIKKKDDEKSVAGNIELIDQMVKNVMRAEIKSQNGRFRLCEINDDRKLPELEFCFSVEKVNQQVINNYLGDNAKLGGETDIEGLMTGFMDLVFEHNNKYYILDWKSNHLGNDVNNYNTDGMEAAMIGSNYHLQYLIYTVALKRWLEKKITNFDFDTHFGGVIYVFLRGVREESERGIYYKSPCRADIERIDKALKGNHMKTN